DEGRNLWWIGEQILEIADRLEDLSQLVEDLLALQSGQPAELDVEDRSRLDVRELVAAHQRLQRFFRGLALPNRADHRVEVVEGDLQSFDAVRSRLRSVQ